MPAGRNVSSVAAALLAAGAIWPWVVGAVSYLLLTPYERALRAAWCGIAPHADLQVLGHCAACWAGSAAFVLAALALMHDGWRARLALSLAGAR
ncbi:hypothetical protein [Terricaulis sp.]|uniref:hypothetical protein n=1 Tax=Terricaulis sp. TaxID=2768686 RepID=UPI003783498A